MSSTHPYLKPFFAAKPQEGAFDKNTSIPFEEQVKFQARQINQVTSFFMHKLKHVIEKVKDVACLILTLAFHALLYWVNPTLFSIGFFAGIIFDDQVGHTMQKIDDVWKVQKLKGILLGGVACALSLPVAFATTSLLCSARFGSFVSSEA